MMILHERSAGPKSQVSCVTPVVGYWLEQEIVEWVQSCDIDVMTHCTIQGHSTPGRCPAPRPL